MTRQRLLLLLAAVSLAMAFGSRPVAAEGGPAEARAALARLQVFLEYFFMESGTYPETLEELRQQLNPPDLPAKAPKVAIPVDPATGQAFVYRVDPSLKAYSLSVPDPSKYGGDAMELASVDWAWMSRLAEYRRLERMALRCRYQIKEVLATQCEMYAKDHGGQFPGTLDELVPQYLGKHLACPMTGKNYTFTRKDGGYFIGCPNPEKHGLKALGYSSSDGMKVVELEPEAAPAAP